MNHLLHVLILVNCELCVLLVALIALSTSVDSFVPILRQNSDLRTRKFSDVIGAILR